MTATEPLTESSAILKQVPHILIVDDEPDICDLLEAFVRKWGYTSTSISNPQDVARAVGRWFYNVVLLDIMMLAQSGTELIPEIKEGSPDTKIVMMSGYAEKEDIIEALRLGASDFLEKPIDWELLFHTIKRSLHLQKTELEFRKAYEELRHSKEQLQRNEARLKEANRQLMETNNALSVLAQNIDRTRDEVEFQISKRIRTAVTPLIEKLSRSKHLKEFRVDLEILKDFMDDLLAGLRPEPQIAQVLSATELRVAVLIKNGLTTDEIAEHLFVSPYTVKSHRRNIRKKLDLNHSNRDLRGYLQTKFERQGAQGLEEDQRSEG